jgi:hypothetical protein
LPQIDGVHGQEGLPFPYTSSMPKFRMKYSS